MHLTGNQEVSSGDLFLTVLSYSTYGRKAGVRSAVRYSKARLACLRKTARGVPLLVSTAAAARGGYFGGKAVLSYATFSQ